jgi:hypothetical protein
VGVGVGVGVGGFGAIEKCIVVVQELGMACFTRRIRVTVAPRLLVLMVMDFNGQLQLPQPAQLLFPQTNAIAE